MKKEIMMSFIVLTALLLVIPSVFAINLRVEKTSSNEAWVSDVGQPIMYTFKLTNNGASDSFSFYNLASFSMTPSDAIAIASGETKEITLEVLPLATLPPNGFYTFDYYIRATSDKSDMKNSMTFKILKLQNIFEIGSSDVDIRSNTLDIYIKNREDINFDTVDTTFFSPFFNVEKRYSIGPKETKVFSVQLNREDFKTLMAGTYSLGADVTIGEKTSRIEGDIIFVEKDLVSTTKKDFGLFVNTNTIGKINEGNTIQPSETIIKKNIISRLFTTFSPEPDSVERDGFAVYYTWRRDISPGDEFNITIKTNWLFPLLIILFLVSIVAAVRKYAESSVVLKKRVSFVNAKGGEFALKVTIEVHANKFVERVSVIDRLPALVTLYDKFAGDRPSKVDAANRRIEWKFDKLSPGEKRVLNYIIYSKVGVLGKFALPTATALFERNGEIHEHESNRAFFVAEQNIRSSDDI